MGIDYKLLGKCIKARRKELGIRQSELAEKLGISQGYISDLENGEIPNPTTGKIDALAVALDMNTEKLFEVSQNVSTFNEDEAEYKVNSLNREPFVRVTILGVIRAGEPIKAVQNIIGYEYLPTNMVKGGEYFGLRVTGDSMNNSRILDGDVVIVREQPEVENGDIAVVLVNGEDATIKKFYQTDSTVTLLPNSSNSEYQPRIIDTSKIPVRVLGKVIKVIIDFNMR